MAARVGTVLSDEHILKECAHYQPIPMKLAAKILDGDSVSAKQSPFSSKPLKYVAQLSRPAHFDSYAHSIARNLGNDPEFRGKLHTAYTADIAQHHHENENENENERPDIEMDVADPHLAMMYMARLFDLFEANDIPVPPAANDAPGEIENVAPPEQPDLPNNIDFGGGYDFGADPEPEEDDDIEEVPPLEDEDEGPPPLEEIPLDEENLNVNDSGPSLQLPGNKKTRVRETQFLPKTLPKANVSGMKLRSGTQLQGPSAKKQQGLGPNNAQFPTSVFDARDPFDNPVRISDIETQKTRKAHFNLEQQRLASAKQHKTTVFDAPDPYNTPVRISDIETQKIRKALFNLEQQRLASAKRHSGYGAGTSAPNDPSHSGYFL